MFTSVKVDVTQITQFPGCSPELSPVTSFSNHPFAPSLCSWKLAPYDARSSRPRIDRHQGSYSTSFPHSKTSRFALFRLLRLQLPTHVRHESLDLNFCGRNPAYCASHHHSKKKLLPIVWIIGPESSCTLFRDPLDDKAHILSTKPPLKSPIRSTYQDAAYRNAGSQSALPFKCYPLDGCWGVGWKGAVWWVQVCLWASRQPLSVRVNFEHWPPQLANFTPRRCVASQRNFINNRRGVNMDQTCPRGRSNGWRMMTCGFHIIVSLKLGALGRFMRYILRDNEEC